MEENKKKHLKIKSMQDDINKNACLNNETIEMDT